MKMFPSGMPDKENEGNNFYLYSLFEMYENAISLDEKDDSSIKRVMYYKCPIEKENVKK